MPKAKRKAKQKTSTLIFKAVSAPLRFRILKLLHIQSFLSYSEIMSQLDLNPGRDAGKFAYHLRTLLKARLIEVDMESKKYRLTSLGNTMIGFSQEIQKHISKGMGKLLVRTSRLAMEEFESNKIALALNREAGIPLDLAQRIADETEERLLNLDTLYLTAPLIREFVNAILVEKGLQEYRHKLTRLGLPVYDITQLFKNAEVMSSNVEEIQDLTGKTVMQEYVFLNVLSRKVADSHLSGDVHVNKADCWILKPDELQHDLRVFIQKGFKINRANSMIMAVNPPKTFEAALETIAAMIHASRMEVAEEQGLNHFNIFLAPFIKGMFLEDLRRILKRFVFSLSYISDKGMGFPAVSLGLDFTIPSHLKNIKAIGIGGKSKGRYKDYSEEAIKILVALLDILFEDDEHRPVFTPNMVFTLTEESFKSGDVEGALIKTHKLAAKRGTPYFINSSLKWQKQAVYFTNGKRLTPQWTGDWELDTMRTGCLGTVVINLPRLALEFPRDDRKFFKALNRPLKTALDALKSKYNAVNNRLKNSLLPLLSQSIANEPYLRMKNMSFLISIVGLNEATKMQTGNELHENPRAVEYANKIIGQLVLETKKLSWKTGFRVGVSQDFNNEAATRFAELDVKKYGWKKVFFQGSKDTPYYTDAGAIPLEADISLEDRLKIESSFHSLLSGGHLSLIELQEPERSPEELLKLTKRICRLNIGAYAYTRSYGFCSNCKKSFGGLRQKCPDCKTVKNFVCYNRLASHYLPLDVWSLTQKMRIGNRRRYIV